ncbi:MAG: DUF92 domain-containing protein, partial [Holophagales bacterium]|nr:DUF92 domain-containing protein [Holophagales bacterium]
MSRVSARELLRKVVHMGVGVFAFAVVFLGPFVSALCALAALSSNIFVLPRVGGKYLWRPADEARGVSIGIIAYPAVVLVLILLFWNRLEVAAAVWGIMAFGDGMASLVGMTLGGPRLPWNPKKTWTGSLGYVLFGTAGAATLLWWTRSHAGEPFHLGFLVAAAAVTALVAASIESQPIALDDNLSVPFLAALVLVGMLGSEAYWLGVVAYARRSVDASGFAGGVVIGTTIWAFLGWQGWLVLVAFFVLGTAATKLGYQRKAEKNLAQEGGGRRSARHAFANTGTAMVAAVFAATTAATLVGGTAGTSDAGPLYHPLYIAAFVAAFATATGDTLGSEIGQLYGKRTFLITALRPVPPGTEGAVSLEGTLAGLAGSAAVALLGTALGFYCLGTAALVTLAAFLGTTLESLIGATVEKAGLLDNES